MEADRDLLLQSAARLYALGVDLEGAREELRQLTAAGAAYDGPELQEAYQNFHELDAQWKSLEQDHLDLRSSIFLQ